MTPRYPELNLYTYSQVRASLLEHREIALVDVREEDPHAQAHPLFAANLPFGRIELDTYTKLPCRDVPIVVIDDGEGLAEPAARRMINLGYTDVSLLKGGVSGWQAAGGELFRDVNVPSKAFGELVESRRHTPSLTAEVVKSLIDDRSDAVILDVRPYDEYHTMSIPTAISVPGAELVLRIADLVPNPETRVIINCAGRTRSIIGTQSLINAGIPNPVAALRNGTIGWTLAGQQLEHGRNRRYDDSPEVVPERVRQAARGVADRAGVLRIKRDEIGKWHEQRNRTSYFFDVRAQHEYEMGHLADFRSAPGGQLVQETDMFAPVRGARIVLTDTDGVRANMTASWLAQMGWEVYVLDDAQVSDYCVTGKWVAPLPPMPDVDLVTPARLNTWLQGPGEAVVLDLASSTDYRNGHIPGAWFVLRSQLAESVTRLPVARNYVLTSPDGKLARFAVAELESLVEGEVAVLDGGTEQWVAAGFELRSGLDRMASPPIDRYRRPYEGTDNPREAMQGYLDWEFGLVAQLDRDGTHGFRVVD